jgi:flagella basal body P-ring formation protein FlgA
MKKESSNICYGFLVFLTLVFFFLFSYASHVFAIETKPFQTIKVDEIERRATEYLWERISEEEDNFEVKANFHGMDVILPEGKVDFEFEINGRSKLKAPRIPLVLNINVNGKLKRKLWLNSKAKFFKEVLKTTRNLQKGTVIIPEDIEFSQVDAFREGDRTFINPDEVIGLKVVSNIGKGKVLKLNMVRKPAVVKQGDRVLIMAKMGSMKITTPGVVKEKGFKGSMIRVQNVKSKKEVYGRVVDSHTVEVNF